MAHEVKTFVVQFRDRESLQQTFDRLDAMVKTLGPIQVHSVHDVVHNNEPLASPWSAEYGYKIFPGEAAVERIVVFSRIR